MLGSTWAPACIVLFSVFIKTSAFLRSSHGASVTTATKGSKGFFFDYHLHGQDWHAGFCESRERQSPIDFDRYAPWDCHVGLTPPVKCDHGPLQFMYQPVAKGFTLQNNGISLAADFVLQGYGGITYNNKWFNLLSVNFHSQSEHTFHGRRYPLELHFVHKQYDSGHVLVVAVPFDSPAAETKYKAANPAWQRQINLLQQQKRQPQFGFLRLTAAEAAAQEQADAADSADVARAVSDRKSNEVKQMKSSKADPGFNPHIEAFISQGLPEKGYRLDVSVQAPTDMLNAFLEGGTYFEYRGSLTAPPCAEQATWMVRREPLMASDHQADLIHDNIYKANMDYGNYRSVMPRMGRSIFVRTGVKAEPAATAEYNATFKSNETRASDFGAIAEGRRATQAAKDAGVMARAIDDTLSRAAQAHANNLPASEVFSPPPADHMVGPPIPTPDPHKLLTSIGNAIAEQAVGALSNAVIAAAATVPTVPPLQLPGAMAPPM
jgi:carbonic anhydrase